MPFGHHVVSSSSWMDFFQQDSFLFILEISVADPWYFGVDPDAHPCLWLMDPDHVSGSSYSSLTFKMPAKNKFFFNFLLNTFWRYIYTIFQRRKSKRVTKSRNQGFSYHFCMMIEGSGYGAGSGTIPLTNGSGSGRPKIMWIRIRIRITAWNVYLS